MTQIATRPHARRIRTRTVTSLVLVVLAAIIGTVLYGAASPSSVDRAPNASGTDTHAPPRSPAGITPGRQTSSGSGADQPVTIADGLLPDGVTVVDDHYPGVTGLKPDLLQALRAAADDAADDDITFFVASGWRSARYQTELLREAVATYGSESEAARWVATADTSPHVSGDAVDLGPTAATAWLSEHGAEYGLCQIYRNEPWHYELRPAATTSGCPRMYADPTHDPRMQQSPSVRRPQSNAQRTLVSHPWVSSARPN